MRRALISPPRRPSGFQGAEPKARLKPAPETIPAGTIQRRTRCVRGLIRLTRALLMSDILSGRRARLSPIGRLPRAHVS